MGRAMKNLRRGGNSQKTAKGPKDPRINKDKGGGIGAGPKGKGIDK